jgi:hypothetical protein
MNFEELYAREQKIREITNVVQSVKPTARFCANRLWYEDGSFRDQLSFLERKHGWQEHGAATSVLFGMLPNCRRGCKCSRGD